MRVVERAEWLLPNILFNGQIKELVAVDGRFETVRALDNYSTMILLESSFLLSNRATPVRRKRKVSYPSSYEILCHPSRADNFRHKLSKRTFFSLVVLTLSVSLSIYRNKDTSLFFGAPIRWRQLLWLSTRVKAIILKISDREFLITF